MDRRSFLATSALAAAGLGLKAAAPTARRTRVLRLAHLTDIHVTADAPDLQRPAEGMIAALRHAQSQPDRPDLIVFGGDMVMDSLKKEKEEVLAQWALWHRIAAAELKLPCRHVLGNHDIWGWAKHDHPAIAEDPDYGKALGLRQLGLARSYYSFDQAGWHFVVLDSLQVDYASNYGYIARLDDEQFAWLGRDLAAASPAAPICVVSHVPIIAVCSLVDEHIGGADVKITLGNLVHADALRIKDLFGRHPNVRLCLSGHIHLADDFTYRGIRYCCNGAVSGNWWKGAYEEYGPAYALVDLYDDGSAENTLVPYRGAS
jgi:Icc protein